VRISAILSFGRLYGVLFCCTAAENVGKPAAAAAIGKTPALSKVLRVGFVICLPYQPEFQNEISAKAIAPAGCKRLHFTHCFCRIEFLNCIPGRRLYQILETTAL
jgi:hypothetical protein